MGNLVIGVDLSTQSCTVEVRRVGDFHVVATGRVPLPQTTPPVSEQSPADWWDALKKAFELVRTQVDLSEVKAISVSGQCHGLVPLDAHGEPIRPAKLWNDTTSAPHIEKLINRFGRKYWAERVGTVPPPAFTISKLAWLIEEEPETIAQLGQILLPHDYITFRLCGKYVTDRSEASGTGYFDSVRNVYDFDLLHDCFGQVVEWEKVLPRVAMADEVVGTVTADVAAELGLPKGVAIAVGGGDQHVAALGLGIAVGDVVFSFGTSGTVYTLTDRPVITGTVDGVASTTGGWLPLICTLNSTKVTDWAASILGVNISELNELAAAVLDKVESVPVFAAYLDGERNPDYPGVTGVMAGLTPGTTREEFALSAFLGVVLGLVRGLETIAETGVSTDGRVIAVGGGARSQIYTQFLADVTGRVVEVIEEPEATARGAGIQALAVVTGEGVERAGQRLKPGCLRKIAPRGKEQWSTLNGNYLQVCDFAKGTASLRTAK